MGDCSVFLLFFSFALALMLNIIGLNISTPHKMPVLFWMSVFAPIFIPFGLTLFIWVFIEILEKIKLHQHTNINLATATMATLDEHTLQPESREPPYTNGVHSFNIVSLPMHLYDKETIEGGPCCPICKELLEKRDVLVQLPLCIHCFHKECIEAWLPSKLTCPVCRRRVDMEVPREIAVVID
jgi:Ring finger domain